MPFDVWSYGAVSMEFQTSLSLEDIKRIASHARLDVIYEWIEQSYGGMPSHITPGQECASEQSHPTASDVPDEASSL